MTEPGGIEGPHADTRHMYKVHAMFRREFSLLPGLVRGVTSGDLKRLHIVADHIHLLITILHEHHGAEDEHLWPLLRQRGGGAVAAIAHLMESHHATLGTILTEIETEMPAWRRDATLQRGAALADVIDRLVPPLSEHLVLEESRALPLVERYVSAAEWEQMVQIGRARISSDVLTLVMGMVAYEDPDSTTPQPASALHQLAAETFASYSQRVHGTTTPLRSTDL